MKKTAEYESYEDYCTRQMSKTLNPEKREKWLNEEWNPKIEGFFQVFSRFSGFLKPDSRVLCIGARTGQEVVALNRLGIKDVTGIDLVECPPHVIKGDMHNLSFDDESFDFVFSNIFDHSLYPKKFISEIERVLKVDGICSLQFQISINQDEFTEHIIENPFYDILPLFDISYCHHVESFPPNFAGMNFEVIMRKDRDLTSIFKNYGTIETIEVPDDFNSLWFDINLPIQSKKLDDARIFDPDERENILNKLSKRAYFLAVHAKQYNSKNIAEVGTAEGWQFYTFCKALTDEDSIWSCDIRDARSKKYKDTFKSERFVNGNSLELAKKIKESNQKIDFFYIDGAHDKGSVINDVISLLDVQGENPVWVFDDFDQRFGCFEDIINISVSSKYFKVYTLGKTASGNPTHQVMCKSKFIN